MSIQGIFFSLNTFCDFVRLNYSSLNGKFETFIHEFRIPFVIYVITAMSIVRAKYSMAFYFQRKEFVGQKSLNQSEKESLTAETVDDILDMIWKRAKTFIKREVIVKDEQFEWSENAVPTFDDMSKFITFQDRSVHKCYNIDQVNSTMLSRLRDKPVNVMIHVYGRQLCNKSIHGQFVSRLLKPEQRDRANADSTQSLMALVEVLKQKHGAAFAANVSIWQMWANSIQSAPPHQQEELINSVPPGHLFHLFVRASTSESEIRESAQRGLQVADNMNDTYRGYLSAMRKDFNQLRSDMNRAFDFMEARLNSFEDILESNSRLVVAMSSSITPQPNVVSAEQERQITDLEDLDHSM